jgi:GntR family transcriptional regulator, transcriptional repressor for pyruvate dehydrogenase complex
MKKTSPITVRPVKKETLAEKSISEIKRLIDSGELTPGSRLPSERDLAGMLNVSRPSLREALRALSFLGIIETRHGNGNFLADSSRNWPMDPIGILLTLKRGALIDIFEARVGLDVAAAALGAQRRTDQDLATLRKSIRQSKDAMTDPEQFLKYDLQFHKALAAASKNEVIEDLLKKLYRLYFNERVLLHRHRDRVGLDLDFNFSDHEEILQHIEARNSEKAAASMKRHLEKYKDKLFDQ